MSNIRLPNGTTWPLPVGEDEDDLIRCDGETTTLTKEQIWRLRSIVDAYNHMTLHPEGTEAAVRCLRMLRRAVHDHYLNRSKP